VNRSPRLRWHLLILRNLMIRMRQQRGSGIAVKKPTVVRVDRRLQKVREQPPNHPDARRKQHLPKFNRTVDQLAVQEPRNSSYTCTDLRMLLGVRHRSVPLLSHRGTAQFQLNWLSPFALLFCHCSG